MLASSKNLLPGDPEQIVTVRTRTVSCDGGDGPYGHPLVWLRITSDRTQCPWCSRMFVVDTAHPGQDVHS